MVSRPPTCQGHHSCSHAPHPHLPSRSRTPCLRPEPVHAGISIVHRKAAVLGRYSAHPPQWTSLKEKGALLQTELVLGHTAWRIENGLDFNPITSFGWCLKDAFVHGSLSSPESNYTYLLFKMLILYWSIFD